jgi:uncharacterized protein (DUF433 family)
MTDAEATELAQRLERLEQQIHELRAALARREATHAVREPSESYAAPPEIPTAHPHIIRIPGVQGGEPVVRGVIKTVRGIVELTRMGQTPQEIVDDFGDGLTLAHVYDALSYYYDNQEEMEQIFAEHKAAMDEAVRMNTEHRLRHAQLDQGQTHDG